MKWSFLAGLLTSAAILSPISASAKAETLSSAHLISGKLVRSKFWSSAVGNPTKGDSQQVMQREAQAQVLTLDTLGRGGEGVKAKSPDTLQMSRGLGSGGGEGGGSPSQHAPVVNTKDITLPGRPMLASQNTLTRGASVDGEKGPSLTSGSSRSAVGSFTMPTPVSITVGQHSPEEEGTSGSHSRGGQSRAQAQETSSSSPSHSTVSESPSSEPLSSSIGSMGGGGGGGGGGSSASQEGVLLKPDAVKEYQKLKTEKAQTKIPVAPSRPVDFVPRIGGNSDALVSETLVQAKKNLKKVEKQKASSQTEGASLGVGESISAEVVRAAKILGFDVGVKYKDAREAKEAFAKAVLKRQKEFDYELERADLAKDKTKHRKLLDELKEFEAYTNVVTNYLEAKYNQRDPSKSSSTVSSGQGVESSVETKPVQKAITSNLSSSPKIYTVDSTGRSSGNSLLSGVGSTIPQDVLQAAEALGFDLSAIYKDEADAKKALAKAFYTKDKNLNSELEKINPSTDAARFNKLGIELEALNNYRSSLLKYLTSKYDKRNPNEEEIRAAQALGFDLSAIYKDEADAKKALTKVVYTKDKNLNSDLEKTSPTTDAVKYNRLALELAELDGYKTSLMKYLARRYAVAKKGFGSIKVSGGDWKEQLRAFGGQSSQTTGAGKATKKGPTLKELSEELTALDKSIRRAEDELHTAVVADEDETVKELTARIAKFKEDRLVKMIAYDQMREKETKGKTAVVKKVVSGHQAAQEQEALRLFKQQSPTLVPFVEMLASKDQANLLKRKMTILYNANTREAVETRLSGHGSTLERSDNVVNVLGRMSQTQRDSLKEYVGGLEMGARLSALAYLPNYFRVAKYKFPALEKPAPIVKAKKQPTIQAIPEVVVGAKKPSAPKQPEAPRKTIKQLQQELLLQKGQFKLPVKGSGQKDPNDL